MVAAGSHYYGRGENVLQHVFFIDDDSENDNNDNNGNNIYNYDTKIVYKQLRLLQAYYT